MIFSLTPMGRKHDKNLKILHGFTEKVSKNYGLNFMRNFLHKNEIKFNREKRINTYSILVIVLNSYLNINSKYVYVILFL